MAQSDHCSSSDEKSLGLRGVGHPTPNLSITSANRTDALPDITIPTASTVLKEEAQMSVSAGHNKEENSCETVDEAPKIQGGLSTESAGFFLHLQKAVASEGADILSRHKSTGVRILEELAQLQGENTNCIEITRIKSISSLKERASTPRIVLGVVGGTGHGKSSLINALLGEERLIPTNCFRACTAVVTEISWNPSDDPADRYGAEIQFISADDWDRELEYLFHDVVASSGEVSSECQLEESVAGIAWAKIKAVYPKLNRQSLGQINAKLLADDPEVKALLGTTKTVRKPTADVMYDGIRVYVDSKKARNHNYLDGKEYPSARKMELWPLIKVVRIYVKADVLSSGAIIVDLPGVKDSNSARAAVAGKYIEKCDGLWVVSMITRAVDDQAAQELLGTGFKRQLQLDGNYSNITFICTKTDDINIAEAADSLGLTDEVEKLRNAKHRLSDFEASSVLDNLKKRQEAVSLYAEEIDKHIDRYEKLRTRQANGKTVIPPKEYPKERKIATRIGKSAKRRKIGSGKGPQDTQWVSTEDVWGDLERGMPKFSADYHLTQVDIQLMVEYLRSRKQTAIDEKGSLRQKIDENEERLEILEQEVCKLEELLHETCVSRRSDYSRQAIRDQFALGLKEFDQQEAQQIDPSNFDPDQELRDYAEVGRSLPVFCTSARAYQLLAKDEEVGGFGDMSDTEIPQLKAHTRKLTETTRIKSCRSFLTDLVQMLNSLYLWSSKQDVGLYLTNEEKQAEMVYVREKVNELEKRLQLANEELSNKLKIILEALFRCFEAAALHAAKRAVEIVQSWPSYKRGDGGLPCMSYKATIRRDGVFSGKHGPRNFNEELAAPLLQFFGSDCEATFTKKVPEALDRHAETCKVHLEYVQGLVRSRMRERTAFNNIIGLLRDQDRARSDGLTNKINSLKFDITASQREANRDFTSAIQKKLKPKYKECSLDSGPGVFARTKLEMETEVAEHRLAIFNGSYKLATEKLSKIPETVQRELRAYIGIMQDRLISDYSNVIQGADGSQESKVAKQRVLEFLQKIDTRFQ